MKALAYNGGVDDCYQYYIIEPVVRGSSVYCNDILVVMNCSDNIM